MHLAFLKFVDEGFEISGCFWENILKSFPSSCSDMCIFISFFLSFRPKWAEASNFNTFDGLITAMAYRVPHVVCILSSSCYL